MSNSFCSCLDWELLIRYFIADTPASGRDVDGASSLLSADFVDSIASFIIDFASSAVNDDCNKPRFATCTCSSNADGDDADMDRGDDEPSDANTLHLSSSFSSFFVGTVGCGRASTVSTMELSSGVSLMPCNFPMVHPYGSSRGAPRFLIRTSRPSKYLCK